MDTKQASIRKTRTGRERKAIYVDLRVLRKEFRDRERKCIDTLVKGSKVVLATLHGAGGFQVRDERFDVVVVDEVSCCSIYKVLLLNRPGLTDWIG